VQEARERPLNESQPFRLGELAAQLRSPSHDVQLPLCLCMHHMPHQVLHTATASWVHDLISLIDVMLRLTPLLPAMLEYKSGTRSLICQSYSDLGIGKSCAVLDEK
jgi:hypothetical protein